jgi:hypothetical protein
VADIVSLILQAIGGGGSAVKAKRGEDTHTSTQISESKPKSSGPVVIFKWPRRPTMCDIDLIPVLAGILFQLGTMSIFSALAIDFIVRVITHKPWAFRLRVIERSISNAVLDHEPTASPEKVNNTTRPSDAQTLRRVQFLLVGVAFASVMIYVRGIYRSIELAQGWKGKLITNEPYFTWLDGLPMVLCFASLAASHPGFLLPKRAGWRKS